MKNVTISDRLTSSLLLALLLFMLATLAVGRFITQNKTATHIDVEADRMVSSLTTVLQNPMWQLDETTASYIGQSFLENELISHIAITDRRGNNYYFEGDESNVYLTKSAEIVYNSRVLGTVIIKVDRAEYHDHNNELLVTVGTTLFWIIVAIAGITGTLLRYLLQKPLRQLSKLSEDISRGEYSSVAEATSIYKEFHPLLLTFKKMSTRIDEQMNDLRSAESKYRRLVDNLTNGFLFRYGSDGQFSYVSASVSSVLGHTIKEFKLRNFAYYLTDNQHNHIHANNTKDTLSGKHSGAYEVEIEHCDGSYRWLEISEIPVVDEKSGDTVVEGIAYDITLRKEMELRKSSLNKELEIRVAERTNELELLNTDLIQVKDEAIRANNSKSTFLANMSHELRTPLNAILGMAQLIETDENLPENFIEDIQLINKSGSYLLTLINDVLEISKIEAGSVENNSENSDIRACIEHSVELLRPRAIEKGLIYTLTIDESIPKRIQIDRRKVQQIIINLLGNSIKFTNSGSIQCDVTLASNQMLKIKITDTGAGISSEEQTTLFTPFVQTASGISSKQGTGLGLYITKQFAELLGGDIRVKSDLNKGSTFTVTILFDTILGEIESNEDISYRYKLQNSSQVPNVLIADDDFSNRMILARTLEISGCKVHIACDGVEAVDKYKLLKPDLIWMDMQMPEKDGFEATSEIRLMEKTSKIDDPVTIVALTASAFKSDKDKILNFGCDDFVRKPFKRDEIFKVMENYLDISFVREKLSYNTEIYSKKTKKEDNKNVRIYVLDDNPVNLKVISGMLMRSGFQPELFTQVADYEKRLEEHVPNIAFLDLQLYNDTGFNVLERMKKSTKFCNIPVAILSASDSESDKRKAITLGAQEYLMKPYLMNEIIKFVEEHI